MAPVAATAGRRQAAGGGGGGRAHRAQRLPAGNYLLLVCCCRHAGESNARGSLQEGGSDAYALLRALLHLRPVA